MRLFHFYQLFVKEVVMRKLFIMLAFFAVAGSMLPAIAQDVDRKKARKVIDRNESQGRKLRAVLVKEINGEKVVFIRLTLVQLLNAKGRAKLRKLDKYVRVLLRPFRQFWYLRKIIRRLGKKPKLRLAIRIPSRMIRRRGLKALYVVRPLHLFVEGLRGKGDDLEHTEDNPVVV